MDYLLLIAGIALLIAGGDLLVRGAVGIAQRFAIPSIIIGLTIVAFGTSAPELVVSLKAALADAPGIAVGNIVGSNIANILLVIGMPALIAATVCDQTDIERNALWMLAASIMFLVLCHLEPLTLWHGAAMLAVMTLFLVDTGRRAMAHRQQGKEDAAAGLIDMDALQGAPRNMLAMTAFVVLGLALLPAGGHLTVVAAQEIARDWGISEAAIGLTLVALGTSLPELATALVAVARSHHGIALGNVLGSNLFNILAIMGLVSVLHPVDVPDEILTLDLWIMMAVTLLVMPFALARITVTRVPAVIFVAAYIGYVALVLGGGEALFAASI